MKKNMYVVELLDDGSIETGLSGAFNHLPIEYLEKTIETIKNDLNVRLQERRELNESSDND